MFSVIARVSALLLVNLYRNEVSHDGSLFVSPHFVGGAARQNPLIMRSFPWISLFMFRKALDTFKFLRHVMRANLSARPKCSHRCVSRKETPLKRVEILTHATRKSTEQTSMRAKWFKHITIHPIFQLLHPYSNFSELIRIRHYITVTLQ